MKSCTDSFILKSGAAIPCIGYGTWQTPDGETAEKSVCAALEAGCRHIDTAAAYGNEESVGQGIKASGVAREDIFVTTKHWITDRGYEKTLLAAKESLRRLDCGYIDLYLIHWPCVEKISPEWAEINRETWRGFEQLKREGLIRHIGVSNFLPHHLQSLMDDCQVMPEVNQIEFHPGYTQPETVQWCRERGILVEAWSPLGCGAVLGDPLLCRLGEKYGKSPAQICIAYALKKGVLPLPKSVHPDRIRQNLQVFDFALSDEDTSLIDAMPRTGYSGYYPDDAPADAL